MANESTNGDTEELARINYALDLTYDPRSTSDNRRSALQFLDDLKKQPEAPHHGFSLARDESQQPAARHFGLSLLEYGIRYRWEAYSEEQASTLRRWVIALADSLSPQDPAYFRNKLSHLWIEVTKREWAGSWMDMDALLFSYWQSQDSSKSGVYKLFVLSVFEGLSEDICNREDPVAGLRQDTLGQALNEVIIPRGLFADHLEARGKTHDVRRTQEGWLSLMCAFLQSCTQSTSSANGDMANYLVKTLEALKPTLVWLSLGAIIETNCIDCLFLTLACPSETVQMVAVEVLYAILNRQYNPHFHDTWSRIVLSAVRPERIQLLKSIHMASQSPPEDIDDVKYTLQKKLSEVLSVLGDIVAQHPRVFEQQDQIHAILDILLTVLPNDSLLVSIPALHSFTKLIGAKNPVIQKAMSQIVGPLLQTCSERLIRYESIPSDADNAVVAFLHEDLETLPEQHAFLGNYRRYCVAIIETISTTSPKEALVHIFDQTARLAEEIRAPTHLQAQPSTYVKNSWLVLTYEAQTVVVKSALNGYIHWLGNNTPDEAPRTGDVESERSAIVAHVLQWTQGQLSSQQEHPDVARMSVSMLGNVVTKILDPDARLVVVTFKYILNLDFAPGPSHPQWAEAVQGFQAARLGELQRLAQKFPDYLLEVWSDIEANISSILSSQDLFETVRWGLQSLLLIIIHRASAIDPQTRLSRLQQLLQPVNEAWQNSALTDSVSSFPGFCTLLGMQDLPEYLSSRRFSAVQDWTEEPLDEEGQRRQSNISDRLKQLPLRMTASMLVASVEKLSKDSKKYALVCTLWQPIAQAILPNILALVQRATEFANPDKWSSLPNELQAVVQKILVDRFWQAGISSESRDDFAARISSSGATYEGLASTVRGAPRQIRDACYHILAGMTRFGEHFYGIEGLAEPLATALLVDAHHMTTHHLQRLISLVEQLVQSCPPPHRRVFLSPLLKLFFSQMDIKIRSEWDSITQTSTESTEDDRLSDEMRTESVLRSTTYSLVMFVATLLEQKSQATSTENDSLALRNLLLSDPSLLEPLILFCTHALRMRDTRCCTIICRVLRSVVPVFAHDAPTTSQVREFISTEVLKATITSLNEPYFVEVQRDLANLIANIICLYAPKTRTPRDLLLSLPDMSEAKVDKAVSQICAAQSERTQRVLVLSLLEGVRGVSIHEAGKIERANVKQKRSAMQQQFMEVEQRPTIERGNSAGLEGVAGMFGNS